MANETIKNENGSSEQTSENKNNTQTTPAKDLKGKRKDPSDRKVAQKQPVDQVLAEYRKVFNKQVSKTYDVQQIALQNALNARIAKGYSKENFEKDIALRLDLLLSCSYFTEACKKHQLQPYAAATHFVLTGWQSIADFILRRNDVTLQPTDNWATPVALFELNRMIQLQPHIREMLEEKHPQMLALPATSTAA